MHGGALLLAAGSRAVVRAWLVAQRRTGPYRRTHLGWQPQRARLPAAKPGLPVPLRVLLEDRARLPAPIAQHGACRAREVPQPPRRRGDDEAAEARSVDR